MSSIKSAEEVGVLYKFTYENGNSFWAIKHKDGNWYQCCGIDFDFDKSNQRVVADYESAISGASVDKKEGVGCEEE